MKRINKTWYLAAEISRSVHLTINPAQDFSFVLNNKQKVLKWTETELQLRELLLI